MTPIDEVKQLMRDGKLKIAKQYDGLRIDDDGDFMMYNCANPESCDFVIPEPFAMSIITLWLEEEIAKTEKVRFVDLFPLPEMRLQHALCTWKELCL